MNFREVCFFLLFLLFVIVVSHSHFHFLYFHQMCTHKNIRYLLYWSYLMSLHNSDSTQIPNKLLSCQIYPSIAIRQMLGFKMMISSRPLSAILTPYFTILEVLSLNPALIIKLLFSNKAFELIISAK